MPLPRAPWWMYALASVFLAFLCFVLYAGFVGPEPVGIGAGDFTPHGLHLEEVARGSPLERAGVHDGDRLVAIGGHPIRSAEDWRRERALVRANTPIDVEVERTGTRVHKAIVLNPDRWNEGHTPGRVSVFPLYVVMFSLLMMALLVFFRPHDLSLRLGSALWAAAAVSPPIAPFGLPPYGWAATWRGMPVPLQFLFAIPALAVAVAPALTFGLFAVFPREYFSSRRRVMLLCLPSLILAPMLFLDFWPTYVPAARPHARVIWGVLELVYTPAAYVVLALHYRRLSDQNDRRRVRAIIPATVMFWIVFLHSFIALKWQQWFETAPPVFFSQLAFGIDMLLFQCSVLMMAYAVFAHRVFDIGFVVRRGIQYALARGVMTSVLPVAAVLLAVDVAWHRDQTVGAILSQRGWLYAAIGALALIARQRRQSWLDALDRRFFRERYNAQQLLREVAEEIRQAPLLAQVAPRVVTRIETALHPEFAAILIRAPRDTTYHVLASVPAGVAPLVVPADSKLIGLLRLLGKPLQISTAESGWLKRQLPHADTEFLRQARIDLIVPISLSATGHEALLVLGQKKSEEPYSFEDQELLVAIASSLALLLERPTLTTARTGLLECPRCGRCYDQGIGRCSDDGIELTSSAVPRLLTSRYRLDRRLGRGGMGTVYSALDTSLDRHVALKLIREDLVSSSEAAERFRREARAAAAITHRHLVTLYDFAVDADSRAFLVMELLSGTTLRQELRRLGRLPRDRVIEILRGACSALAAAHQRGLVHRDLKPENIFLVSEDGRDVPKILDFGLAKFVASGDATAQTTMDTEAGVLLGTAAYMSPEQLRGKPVSPQWDLWALAVIAYEMLSGANPFHGESLVAALQNAILSGRFAPIEERLPRAPAAWQALFLRALNIDPLARPVSAPEFLAECERAFGSTSAEVQAN